MQIFSAFLCTPTDFKVVFYTLFMHKTVKYPKKKNVIDVRQPQPELLA